MYSQIFDRRQQPSEEYLCSIIETAVLALIHYINGCPLTFFFVLFFTQIQENLQILLFCLFVLKKVCLKIGFELSLYLS